MKGEGFFPATINAIHAAGADRIFVVGGVPAIGADGIRAWATSTPVDMLCGAGNKYVAEAKRQLFGRCGIDLLAGPTEILVIADDSADPAPGRLRPARPGRARPQQRGMPDLPERGVRARSALAEVERQLAVLPTRDVAALSWADNGDRHGRRGCRGGRSTLSDDYAPEHLELHVA